MRKINKKGVRKSDCSKCGKPVEESRLGQGYCKICHAESMRRNRLKHSELSDIQRKKANVRSYVNVYIKRGNIKKEPCIVCGEKAEMHHDDYDKPLLIKWLCREHHNEVHSDINFAAQVKLLPYGKVNMKYNNIKNSYVNS